MTSNARIDGDAPRHFGLYPALVTDLVDPDNLGRIEVKLPWLGSPGEDVRAWATLVTPYADQGQGYMMLPEVDSQVVVGFEAGDLRRPYIVGAAWNGAASLPDSPQSSNNKRLIKSRSGSLLEFDDTDGAAKVTLRTQSGYKLELDEGGMTVTLTHSNGAKLTIDVSGKVTIQGNASVDVQAPIVNVKAPMAKFDGVVKCSTLIATSVVGTSYTPGAGNIW